MGIFEFEFKVLITPYFASIHCTQYMDNMRQSREPSFVITPPCLVNIVNRYFNTGGNKIRKILVGEFVCTGELVLDGFMATVWMVVRYNSCLFVVVCWPLFQFYFFFNCTWPLNASKTYWSRRRGWRFEALLKKKNHNASLNMRNTHGNQTTTTTTTALEGQSSTPKFIQKCMYENNTSLRYHKKKLQKYICPKSNTPLRDKLIWILH